MDEDDDVVGGVVPARVGAGAVDGVDDVVEVDDEDAVTDTDAATGFAPPPFMPIIVLTA